MHPHSGQNYEYLESNLTKLGIHLGDFLTAKVSAKNAVADFEKIDYPLDVKVEKNFAIMEFASAQVTRNSEGALVFQTKDFGEVESINQNLPIGCYAIIIRARNTTTSYNDTLSAEAKATAASPVMTKSVPFLNDYEVPKSKIGLPIPNRRFDNPPSSTYDYIPSNNHRYSNTSSEYLELQNSSSAEPEITMSQLIDSLPTVDLASSPPPEPIPKPRKFLPKQKPIHNVKPLAPAPVVQVTEKRMKAFVHSFRLYPDSRYHFLWICDVMANAVFKSSTHSLELGHFFEGDFRQKSSGEWECTNYVRSVTPLIKGSIVYGKVELTTKISNYQGADQDFKYSHATVKHLGTLVDRYSKLSPLCNGKRVTVQRLRKDGKEYEWVITGVA